MMMMLSLSLVLLRDNDDILCWHCHDLELEQEMTNILTRHNHKHTRIDCIVNWLPTYRWTRNERGGRDMRSELAMYLL